MSLLPLLVACSSPTLLTLSPETLEFGDVDFSGEMPDGGYASATVTIANEGGPEVAVELPEYDFDHLCVAGFPDDQTYPVGLGTLAEGSSYVLEVGVCAYVSGELTTDVVTELVLETDGDPASVTLPVTFTAIRTGE